MERKEIGIKGISTGSNYDDGACLNMMNMRHEQGVLKPVESFPVDYTLKHVYDLLYWHKNNDYAHLIGVRDGGVYWIQHPGEETETEGTSLLIVGSAISLSHIGNILNVLDGETLKYVFWQQNEYFVIDMDFDGEQDSTMLGPVKVDLKVDADADENGNRIFRDNYITPFKQSVSDYNASINEKLRMDQCYGLIIKAVSESKKDGYLSSDFHFACTAIELYDGTFIAHSNPVLLCPPNDKENRYNLTIGGIECDYLVNNALVSNISGSVDLISTNENEGFKIYKEKSTAHFFYKNRVDNQSLSKVSCFSDFGYSYNNGTYTGIGCVVYRNNLKFKIENNIDIKLKSLIKSLSVFITNGVCKHDENKDKMLLFNDPLDNANHYYNFFPTSKTDSEIVKELIVNQKFYKVHEIPFDDIKTTTENDGWVTIDLKGKLGDNLFTQPELVTASFSNIKARNQMTYNSMLHTWDIKNVVSRGWPYEYIKGISGIGQFPVITQSPYNNPTQFLFYTKVYIKTDTETSEVVRYTNELPAINTSNIKSLYPMISFPDSRAYRMVLYIIIKDYYGTTNLYDLLDVKLIASSDNNYSYYISPDLKPIQLYPHISNSENTSYIAPSEINQSKSYQNKLKVSNTNNPFIFPDAQTYQIGDGTILNVASQSIRTSDGQFGQYPLVCFCTDGVFTLQVGYGTVAYSKVGTPQNYERPISKVICVTPYGIAFISNRGLCMVVGQDIEYLSESMFEKFRTVTLELPDQIENLFALDLSSFNDYLKSCTAMVYNPKEQEIIMIHPDKAYNYVYNMSTKQFYRNVEAITNEINNSLPDMQVWTGATIKKVTVIEAGSREISFVTRPIKMQTPDMKRFERVILRAYLSGITGTPATACIWGSIDDRNFKLLRGMVLENSTTRKDIDFGLFGKTTYRSYIIGLSMTVGTDSEIEAIEMQVEKEFLDTKMR